MLRSIGRVVAEIVAAVVVEGKKILAPWSGLVGGRLDSTNVVCTLEECGGVKSNGFDCFGGCIEIIMPGRMVHGFNSATEVAGVC